MMQYSPINLGSVIDSGEIKMGKRSILPLPNAKRIDFTLRYTYPYKNTPVVTYMVQIYPPPLGLFKVYTQSYMTVIF